MEIFIGMVIGFFIQSMVRFGWRVLNPPSPPTRSQPETPAQQANRELYEAQTRHHPRVVSMRIQRRTARGRRRTMMEREPDSFEDQ